MKNFTKEYYKINKLEEKYTNFLWKLINSEDYLFKLSTLEKSLKNDYNYIKKHYDDKNIVKVAIERLIRFFIYKNKKCIDLYPSPLSSDLAVEFDDIILNIDAKTISMTNNKGDDKSIHFGQNQITFVNQGYGKIKNSDIYVSYDPHLPGYYNKKPVLTFFITINYEDNHKDIFKIIHQSLTCIPHKVIAKEKYNNNLISNFKTYKYISNNNSYGIKYNSKKNKSINWKGPMRITPRGNKTFFIDMKLKNPVTGKPGIFWNKMKNGYQAFWGGSSARILKNNIAHREDISGNAWKGVRYKIF